MTIYYVDATGGSDSANGTSELTPWETIDPKVNGASFSAGDTISLKRGESWLGQRLLIPSSGSDGSPITITDYSSGTLPIVDAIHTVDSGGWTEVAGGASTIWDAESQTGDSSWADFTASQRHSRIYIENGEISADATQVRFTYEGHSVSAGVLTAAAFGLKKASDDPYDFDAAPTRITFNTGSNGGTVPGGGQLVSDWITFTVDNTKDHLASHWFAATSSPDRDSAFVTEGSGDNMAYKDDAGDETQTQDVTGYTELATIYGLHLIEKLTATEYYASLATTPTSVFEDGTAMTEGTEGELAVGEWAYNAGTDRLYVRTTGDDDPSGYTIVWCAENASIATNGQDWLVIENVKLGVPNIGIADGYGLYSDGSSNNIIVQDITVLGTLDAYGFGIVFREGPCTAQRNDISRVTAGISLRGLEPYEVGFAATIDGNTIYDVDKGDLDDADCINLGFSGGDFSGTVISNNDLSGFPDQAIDCEVAGVIIENNNIHSPHASATAQVGGIKIWAGENVIRYNLLNTIAVDGKGYGLVITDGNDIEVYYNLIISPADIGIAVQDTISECLRALIYNNTIYDAPDRAISVVSSGDGISATIQNNILDGATEDMRLNAEVGAVAVAGGFNCFMNDAGPTIYNGATYSGAADDLGTTDPLFVNPGGGDFTLQSNSPCINAGVDVGLDRDFAGNPVPQGSAPDIGAYEHTAGKSHSRRQFLGLI